LNLLKLIEIFSRYSWQEIEPHFLRLYPDESIHTEKAWQALAFLKSLSPRNTGIRIEIAYREDEDGNYHDVCGKDGTERGDGLEERFCLALVDWEEWLGMDIEPGVQEMYADFDIVCHCFWEMTWHGYSMDKVIAAREDLRWRAAEQDTLTELEWRKVLEEL
jgi:hypothetical protein